MYALNVLHIYNKQQY